MAAHVRTEKHGGFTDWLRDFEEKARERADREPDWERGARLAPCLVRSLQTFQAGENGDGAFLISKAERAGDPVYTAAVRLFIAEEQNHARLLERLLAAAGAGTVGTHWSDTVFVVARRAVGLRVELLVLMLAEVIALGFYGALHDGVDDPLTAEVAGLALADERRHVPFHCRRIHQGLAGMPGPVRALVILGWRAAALAGAVLIGFDHRRTLRLVGWGRRRFVREVLAEARAAAALMRHPR